MEGARGGDRGKRETEKKGGWVASEKINFQTHEPARRDGPKLESEEPEQESMNILRTLFQCGFSVRFIVLLRVCRFSGCIG